MSYIDKIEEFCAERKISLTRFEREAGLSKGLISRWKSGKVKPRIDTLKRAADYMGITVEDLMSEDSFDLSRDPAWDDWSHQPDIVRDARVRYIPVLRYPGTADHKPDPDNIITHLPVLPDNLIDADNCFGMIMEDSSMVPDIEPDDILVVRKDNDPSSGEVVVVDTPGEPALCRRLVRSGDSIILQPFSRHYDPVVYRTEETDLLPVSFRGTVIAIIRRRASPYDSSPEE